MKKVLKIVRQRIHPDTSIKSEIAAFLDRLNSLLKKNRVTAKAVAGGSIAKGTHLKDDFDIDIFIKFKYSKYKTDDLSAILEKVLRPLKVVKVHGSRDYFHVYQKSLRYELVPVLDVKNPDKAMNVMDMSPLHVKWVSKYMKKDKKLSDDIRLAKQFCKANNCYGAESYIKGFSGHVIDILIIYHGGFEKLLKASVKWKKKQVIDYCNAHKGRALFNLNSSKIAGPLVVVDPVDSQRNAAAALNDETFDRFVNAAKAFLKSPDKKFFERKDVDEKTLKRKKLKGRKLMLFDVTAKAGKEDIVGSKLLKAFEFIKNSITKNDFMLYEAGWTWNKKKKALFYYVCKDDALAKTKTIKGPKKRMKFHAKNFMKKHKKTFVKDGWLYAEVKRKCTKIDGLVKELIKDAYVTEKVLAIRINY